MIRKGFKIGFINQHGKVVVQPQFSLVGIFSEGLVAVMLDSDWGFIDSQGKLAIDYKFYSYTSTHNGKSIVPIFSEGLSSVEFNNKYGYINQKGEFVIPPQFDVAFAFSDGLAMVETEIIKGESETSFIDKSGKVVFRVPNYITHVDDFREGLARVGFKSEAGSDSIGFLNKRGEIAIELNLTRASDFNEGLAVANPRGTTLFGFIDKTGKFVIPPKFKDALIFKEGLAPVSINCDKDLAPITEPEQCDKFGFIDRTGRFVVKPQYYNLSHYYDGLAAFYQLPHDGAKFYEAVCGYINKDGETIIPARYATCGAFRNGIARILEQDKFLTVKYINVKGAVVYNESAPKAVKPKSEWKRKGK